jgi:3-phenylpropionate/cinnamic acid dioxygenase small subunit
MSVPDPADDALQETDGYRPPIALWWDVQEFLHREADLLDSRAYDRWLSLLDERIRYWAPLARNVRHDARETEFTAPGQTAWFDEGIETLRQRVQQLNTGAHWIEEPASRVSHLITNARILAAAGADPRHPEHVKVRCRFLVYLNRLQGEISLHVGKRVDVLRRDGNDWKILRREIYLDQNVLQAKALSVFL